MKKQKVYYLHTIDARPAFYVPGEQICFMMLYGAPSPLAMSLRQIRTEQKASLAWCKERNITVDPSEYGYRRVCLP